MTREPADFYEFGPFRVDARARVVLRGDELVSLTPKAVELLLALIESRGDVLTKDQLMKQVWPDSFVEEANLSHQIYKLREALSDGSAEACIQTVPRRGYRFIAPVVIRSSTPSPPSLSWGEQEIRLSPGANLLGRTADCIVRFEAVSVSRVHARLVVNQQGTVVEDLDSKNGTFVNGTRITGQVTLRDGDEIRIGAVPLTFHSTAGLPSTRTVERSS